MATNTTNFTIDPYVSEALHMVQDVNHLLLQIFKKVGEVPKQADLIAETATTAERAYRTLSKVYASLGGEMLAADTDWCLADVCEDLRKLVKSFDKVNIN